VCPSEGVGIIPKYMILEIHHRMCVYIWGLGWRCATSRTVPGSIPGGVTVFFSNIFFPTAPWPWDRLSL